MTLGQYLVGLLLFAAILAGACFAAVVVVGRRRPALAGAERALAVGVLATAALLGAYMIPGILGILDRWTPALFAVLLAAAARSVRPVPSTARDRSAPASAGGGESVAERTPDRVVAALTVLAAGAAALAFVILHATKPVDDGDQLQFHLPVVARWIQTGSIWGVHDFLPYYGLGNYPQTGDVLSLAAISPWRYDAFQRFAELPYFVLGGIAVYALARRLGAGRPISAVAGALLVSIPSAILPSVSAALPDAMLVACFASGLVFLARSDYVLAGVGFGLAFGAKWYGVSIFVVVLALWAVAMLVARRPPRRVLRSGVLVGLVTCAVGGFWLLRNTVGSGTPFFPGGWLPFGSHPSNDFTIAIGHGPVDFTIAHYAFDGRVWRDYLLPELYRAFRLPGILLLAVLPVAVAALARDWRRGRLDRAALVALSAAILLAILYTLTPASAQGGEGAPLNALPNARYLLPAAVPAAALGAWLAGRLGRWVVLVEAAALVAVLDASHDALHYSWARFAVALALLAAAGALVYAVARAGRPAVIGAAAAAAIAIVVGGQLIQTRYGRNRFDDLDPAVVRVARTGPSSERIALAGYWAWRARPVYPAFGKRLRNYVEYLGPRRRERLTRYASRAEFVSALRRSRADELIVGLGEPAGGGTARDHVVETDWARGSGYVLVMRTELLELYRRPGAHATGAATSGRLATFSPHVLWGIPWSS